MNMPPMMPTCHQGLGISPGTKTGFVPGRNGSAPTPKRSWTGSLPPSPLLNKDWIQPWQYCA